MATNDDLGWYKRSLVSVLLLLAGKAVALEPPPLEAYGQLPTMELVTLSPSGERVAFAANGQDQRRLYVSTVSGEPLATTTVDQIKLRNLRWAGEQFVVAGSSATFNLGVIFGYRHELFNYSAINLANRQVLSLLDDSHVLNAAFGFHGLRTRDDRWYAYLQARAMKRSGLTNVRYLSNDPSDLYEVDLENGKLRKAADGCKGCGDWLLGADGNVLASVQYEQRSGQWSLYAGNTNSRLLMRAKDPRGYNGILGQGRSAGTVLVQVGDDNDAVRYFEVPLSGAAASEILPRQTVNDFVWDPRTQLLVGFVREGDEPELVLFDERAAARLRGARKAFPGLSVRLDSWSDDFGRMVVYTQGSSEQDPAHRDAGTYWLVDVASGQAKVMGDAYPQVPSAQVGAWRMIDYRAADGLALRGVLTLPPGVAVRPLPLVVLPHGGPAARDYPHFDWWAQAFASRGYAVWQPNFRGSAGYGAALLNAGYGEWGGKMQTDISDGVAELARQGIVDVKRACIVGASYGGYAALAGVTLQQGLYRCAVSVNGVADLKALVLRARERTGDAAVRYWLRFLGTDSALDGRLGQRSPVNLAARADAPVLLIHGRDDTVVPYTQSQAMQRALKAAAKPVELFTLAGEDHWLSREQTRTQMLKAAVDFVQRHNPAEPLK